MFVVHERVCVNAYTAECRCVQPRVCVCVCVRVCVRSACGVNNIIFSMYIADNAECHIDKTA